MNDIYERLRERLDKFPQGFPKTASGVEIEILKNLFTPDEAEIMFWLRPWPEPVSVIAARMKSDEKELGKILYDMSTRGLILRYKEAPQKFYYFLIPWMIGIWEFQLKNLTPENIKLYEQFYKEGMAPIGQKAKTKGFRVIPIEKEIEGSPEIQPFEKISEIIGTQDRFAVAECICRKESAMLGKGCDKLMEACMSFGPAADYYIENGMAREISKAEALEILQKTEEDGLVHFSTNHADNKIFICNCCGCCCKALAARVTYGSQGVIAESNYYAVVDKETCSACETCINRCQVDAIRIQNDAANIKKESCIGCGLCVSTCPTESISVSRKKSDELSFAYPTDMDLMQALGEERKKAYPFE